MTVVQTVSQMLCSKVNVLGLITCQCKLDGLRCYWLSGLIRSNCNQSRSQCIPDALNRGLMVWQRSLHSEWSVLPSAWSEVTVIWMVCRVFTAICMVFKCHCSWSSLKSSFWSKRKIVTINQIRGHFCMAGLCQCKLDGLICSEFILLPFFKVPFSESRVYSFLWSSDQMSQLFGWSVHSSLQSAWSLQR